jgi:hypothetical protein
MYPQYNIIKNVCKKPSEHCESRASIGHIYTHSYIADIYTTEQIWRETTFKALRSKKTT